MLTLIQCSFHPCVTTVARKRPRPCCQKCRWQVTSECTYTLDPVKFDWADFAAVQALCGSLSGNELTLKLSDTAQPQSSQLTEPLWTDPGLKSGIIVRKLISTSERIFKKRRHGMNRRTFSQNPCKRGKSRHHHHLSSGHLVNLIHWSSMQP